MSMKRTLDIKELISKQIETRQSKHQPDRCKEETQNTDTVLWNFERYKHSWCRMESRNHISSTDANIRLMNKLDIHKEPYEAMEVNIKLQRINFVN